MPLNPAWLVFKTKSVQYRCKWHSCQCTMTGTVASSHQRGLEHAELANTCWQSPQHQGLPATHHRVDSGEVRPVNLQQSNNQMKAIVKSWGLGRNKFRFYFLSFLQYRELTGITFNLLFPPIHYILITLTYTVQVSYNGLNIRIDYNTTPHTNIQHNTHTS